MTTTTYLIEGLDRVGKSTLIQNIRQAQGNFTVIHYGKPQKLPAYGNDLFLYQHESFRSAMQLVSTSARLIMDRAWLGEAVYANRYRGYDGSYVFDMEREAGIDRLSHVRLILLTENMSLSRHFVDDGDSLGPVEAREAEQQAFIAAFNRSIVADKRLICVTDLATGAFRSQEAILREAIS
jgi:thymidylate kinase